MAVSGARSLLRVCSVCFFFSSRRRHTRYWRDWSSDVCSSDLHKIHLENGESYYLYIFNRLLILDDLISNVIEHIDEIVVLFDENGTLRKMNGICDELLPFKRKDVLRKNIKIGRAHV